MEWEGSLRIYILDHQSLFTMHYWILHSGRFFFFTFCQLLPDMAPWIHATFVAGIIEAQRLPY